MQEIKNIRSRAPLPMEDVLRLLGFEENKYGSYERRWGRLTVACGVWLCGWHFMCDWYDGRTLGFPEFRTQTNIAPVTLLAEIYHSCGDAFPSGGLPRELAVGKEEYQEQRRLRALIPRSPTVWADRQFMRFCLTYLEKADDWSSGDYTIGLSASGEQLIIKSRSRTVYCPARGAWPGSSEVSARDIYRRLPKRFSGDVVTLVQRGGTLLVDSHVLPARWTEPPGETSR